MEVPNAQVSLDWIPQTMLAGTAMSIIFGYGRLRSVAKIKYTISTSLETRNYAPFSSTRNTDISLKKI